MSEPAEKTKMKLYTNACAMFDIRIGLNDILKFNSLYEVLNKSDLNEGDVNKCKENIISLLKIHCKKYVFQLEIGKEGYIHFQGRISLIKKHRLDEIKNIFRDYSHLCPLFNYIAPTANATYYKGDNFYVIKEETRIFGPWDEREPDIYIPIHYRGKIDTLLPFQRSIIASYNPLNDREIHLVYCPEGNVGKSTLSSLIHLYQKGRMVPPFNNMKDIMTYLCDIYYEKEHSAGILCFDLPRAMPKHQLNEMFAGIELLKTGFLYDNRYRTREWWIDSPTIWVFSNDFPNLSLLSKDRWRIYKINEQSELHLLQKVEIDQIIKEKIKLLEI